METPKTIEQIKDEVAKTYAHLNHAPFKDWPDLLLTCITEKRLKQIDEATTKAVRLYALQFETSDQNQDIEYRKHYISSNVHNKQGISTDWLKIWEQIEIWYGDVKRRESAHELLKRLQAAHSIPIYHELPGVKEMTEIAQSNSNIVLSDREKIFIRIVVKEMRSIASSVIAKKEKEKAKEAIDLVAFIINYMIRDRYRDEGHSSQELYELFLSEKKSKQTQTHE